MKTSITGVKPTGTPHLGNYFGAIEPALRLADTFETFYFIADAHALNALHDPTKIKQHTLEIAASFLAFGLDPKKSFFYRQSDVPEVFELTMLLSNIARKSTMDLSHAYKAAIKRNRDLSRSDDDGINMGLYLYPLLMAADILLVSAEMVPVGKDQVQHVEFARELVHSAQQSVGDLFTRPTPLFSTAPILLGLDGRKMSKSYHNTIPLFATSTQLKKLTRQYQTDSTTVEEKKSVEGNAPFQLYELVASKEKAAEMKARIERGGTGWGVLKEALFVELDQFIAKPREVYEGLLRRPDEIEAMLEDGARRVRRRVAPLMSSLRAAMYGRKFSPFD
jgi:tryptophanyl-tRNA synthetase